MKPLTKEQHQLLTKLILMRKFTVGDLLENEVATWHELRHELDLFDLLDEPYKVVNGLEYGVYTVNQHGQRECDYMDGLLEAFKLLSEASKIPMRFISTTFYMQYCPVCEANLPNQYTAADHNPRCLINRIKKFLGDKNG